MNHIIQNVFAETSHHGELMNLKCLHRYSTLKRDEGMLLQQSDHAFILSCLLATEKYKLPSPVEGEDVANVSQIFCRM